MASLRIRAANAVLKNLTRVNTNNNVRLAIHRENHVLSGSLICFMQRTSPSLTSIRNTNPFRVTYRLEHAAVIPTEGVAGGKTLSTSTMAHTSEAPKSNAIQSVSEVKVDNNSADVPHINSRIDESMLPEIPEAPVFSTFVEEPTLSSLGLGGWSPSGIVQQILEFFHVNFNMPWWACIASLTILVRIILFPLTVKARRDTINYQNNMPLFQKLQNDLSAARRSGNYYEAARAGQEFTRFMQEKSASPAGMLFATLIQAPVFISVYFALKNMAAVPEFTSFQTGGLLWFTDLSVPDQFYLLPLFTSFTIWATLKYGVSMKAVPSQFSKVSQANISQSLQIGIPVIVFLFTMNFPTGVLCYWTASNIFVLCQTFLLNVKQVKKYFNIPSSIDPVMPTKDGDPNKKLGLVEGFKESYANIKISREIEQRELLNAIKFEDIGNKPAKRTFKFDPTKASKLAQAKEK